MSSTLVQPSGQPAALPAQAIGARRAGRRRLRREWLWALFFLGPNLFLFLSFTLFPMLFGFGVSFFRWTIIEPPVFVGLDNYSYFFAGDPLTGKIVRNSLVYVIGALPASVLLPLGLAVLLNAGLRGTTFFRAVYFLPLVTSGVAAAIIFKWIYGKQAGPLNIIFYLAALQGVDRTLYEAARIDGANRWQQFRYVTWPMVTPTTFFVLIITTIALLVGAFDQIRVMTDGGPLDASNVLGYNIWRTAFVNVQMGYASAMAYILFLVVLTFTAIQWVQQKRWVHY